MRRRERLILVVAVAGLAAGGPAVAATWIGECDNNDYDCPENWDRGYFPTVSDDVVINGELIIEQGCNPLAGAKKLMMGTVACQPKLTMDNPDSPFYVGTRTGTTAEMIMADHPDAAATFIMNRGTFDISHSLRVGNKGRATVHMNGGTLDIQYQLSVPHNDGLPGGSYPNSEGTLYLDGGLILCRDFSMKSATDKGHVYITDGVMTIERVRAWNFDTGTVDAYVDNSTPGVVAAYVQGLVSAGYIVAANPGDHIVTEWTTTGGYYGFGTTTIYAVPEPVTLVLLGLGGLLLVRRRRRQESVRIPGRVVNGGPVFNRSPHGVGGCATNCLEC